MNPHHGVRVDPVDLCNNAGDDGSKQAETAAAFSLAPLWRAIQYCRCRPWWVTLALCVVFDALVRFGVRRPSIAPNARLYLWGFAMSLGMYYWIGLVYRMSPGWLKRLLAVVIALFAFLTLSVNFLIYKELGQYVTRSMLQFMLQNAFYFKDYSVTYLLRASTLVGIVFLAALVYLWYPARRRSFGVKTPRTVSLRQESTRVWLIHIPLAYVLSLIYLTPYMSAVLMPVTTATVWALAVSQPPAKSELHYSPNRFPLKPIATEANPPNILIIASESWGKQQGLPFYGESVDAMPFLTDWIRKDPDHFIVWKTGYTSSTATDVSLPSIVTGVEPDESARKLHDMPLLWQWGKAAGAYTFYLTSVRESFARLDLFFKCNERDATFSAENINSPIVHEAGVDDIVTTGKVRDVLAARRPGDRFVGMIFTNALHSPFQEQSQFIPQMPAFESRYDKALYIVDRAIQTAVEALKEKGVLDNTIIFFTADHGETPAPRHSAHRIFSYYEEFFNIPYIVYVPERWKASHRSLDATLRANQIQNVSNLDILPTIVDLLGLTDSNAGVVAQMKGRSLVRPLDPRRVLVGLGTNDVRTWEQEGMGLVWGPYRFVCNNVEGAKFFDLVSDPAEERDRWPTLDSARKRTVMRAISSSYHLNRLCGSAR